MTPLLRVCQDLSVFQGEESHLAPSFRLTGRLNLRQRLSNYINISILWGHNSIPYSGLQTKRSGSTSWVTVSKIKAPDKGISSFLGGFVGPLQGQEGVKNGFSLLTSSRGASAASSCGGNLKPLFLKLQFQEY